MFALIRRFVPFLLLLGVVSLAQAQVPVCSVAVSDSLELIGHEVTLTATCSNNPSSYAWSGCSTVSGNVCKDTAITAGPKQYFLTARNQFGDSNVVGKQVYWQFSDGSGGPPAGCTISAVPSTHLTAPGKVTLVTSCATGSLVGATYSWTANGAAFAATQGSIIATLSQTTTFTVVPHGGAGDGNRASITITVDGTTTPPGNPGNPPPATSCTSPKPVYTQTLACTGGLSGSFTQQAVYACSGNAWTQTGWQAVQSSCQSTVQGQSSLGPALYTAWEFYHPGLDQYFMTANPEERDLLDNGFGDGMWKETGVTYRVWALNAPGTNAMCRFYGDTHINPATGMQIGPNSHFYTASPEECAAVPIMFPVWVLEGRVFGAAVPNAASQCPVNTRPVYRFFKPFGVPNHRYVLDEKDVAEMTAEGWLPEGPTWCSGL